MQDRELAVFRPEIVPPLRHAMRLVDGEKRQPHPRQKIEAARHHQTLGRDIEEIDRTGADIPLDRRRLWPGERRIEVGGVDAGLAQRVYLVLHQGDERRDHHAKPGPHQRWDLIAQRLAAAGRHQHQAVTAGKHMPHDRFLLAAERGIAEHLAQDAPRLVALGLGRRVNPHLRHRPVQKFSRSWGTWYREFSGTATAPSHCVNFGLIITTSLVPQTHP